MKRFDVITLFPEMVRDAAGYGVTGNAIKRGVVELRVWNPREYTRDKHRAVDDRPYGGGPGMVMKFEPLRDAIQAARDDSMTRASVIYLSPQGRRLTQRAINAFTGCQRMILVAGRYEGIDQRLIDAEIDEEWSVGDFVLSGGELAALIMIDAVTRLLPGVLGHVDSARQDSHMQGLLDCPHYTRPASIEGKTVPSVLQSGNHEVIRRWRIKQALGRTWLRRPDLLAKFEINAEQEALLAEFINEVVNGG